MISRMLVLFTTTDVTNRESKNPTKIAFGAHIINVDTTARINNHLSLVRV